MQRQFQPIVVTHLGAGVGWGVGFLVDNGIGPVGNFVFTGVFTGTALNAGAGVGRVVGLAVCGRRGFGAALPVADVCGVGDVWANSGGVGAAVGDTFVHACANLIPVHALWLQPSHWA